MPELRLKVWLHSWLEYEAVEAQISFPASGPQVMSERPLIL